MQKERAEIDRGLTDPAVRELLGSTYDNCISELELIQGAGASFALDKFLSGELTPVFFGTTLNGFGVNDMLDHFVMGTSTQAREANAKAFLHGKQFTPDLSFKSGKYGSKHGADGFFKNLFGKREECSLCRFELGKLGNI